MPRRGLAAKRQRNRQPVDMRDTQIAAIVVARRAKLTTRNVEHFADLSVEVVNPWAAVTGICRDPKYALATTRPLSQSAFNVRSQL
jgi:hypothetical protein